MKFLDSLDFWSALGPIIFVSKAVGAYPLCGPGVPTSRLVRVLARCYQAMLLTAYASICYGLASHMHGIWRDSSTIYDSLLFLMLATTLLCHAAVIVAMVCHLGTVVRIARSLSQFQFTAGNLKRAWKLQVCLILSSASFAAIMSALTLPPHVQLPGVVTALSFLIVDLAVLVCALQFATFVHLVTAVAQNSNALLRSSAGRPPGRLARRVSPAVVGEFSDASRQLGRAASVRAELDSVSGEINSAFSVQILALMATHFVYLVFNLYGWLVTTLGEKTPFVTVEDSARPKCLNKFMLFFLKIFLELGLLIYVCERAHKEADRTGLLVHKLINQTHDSFLRYKLTTFSLQLLHSKIRFNACGFFPMDNTTLHSIVAACATYLVILSQFSVPSCHKTSREN